LAQKNKEEKSKEEKNKEEGNDETMSMGQLYLFVRNMLKLGLVLEKRKQYDFAYLTYGELCKRIIRERNIAISELKAGIALRKSGEKYVFVKTFTKDKAKENKNEEKLIKEAKNYYDNLAPHEITPNNEMIVDVLTAKPQPLFFKNISPNTNDVLFKKMTFEGLKLLYLPFIAKLQILEKSHVGGITCNHLKQLDREFEFLTSVIDHQETKILEADFFSRVADVLYYKNSDLKCKKGKSQNKNHSCTACDYYRKALFRLLNETTMPLSKIESKIKKVTPLDLLEKSIKNIENNYNMKHCTVLARILSDWGNVFYSCDKRGKNQDCYLDKTKCSNTPNKFKVNLFIMRCINYVKSESNGLTIDLNKKNISKMEIAFAMYAVSLKAYSKANLFKRSAYQINKMLRLFKSYEVYKDIDNLGKKAIRSLWYAAEDLNVFEVNKRKKDFGQKEVNEKIPLQNILVDSEISRIRVLVKDLELKASKTHKDLKKYYDLHITSPYSINYSISARIYQLRLKSMVNYKMFKVLVGDNFVNIWETTNDDWSTENKIEELSKFINHILTSKSIGKKIKRIFSINETDLDNKKLRLKAFERLIAESISCLKETVRLSKTIGETYFFNHSFMGEMHYKLSFWVRIYEAYSLCKSEESKIDDYLKNYIGEEWKEKLSGYYENQQALSHYYKCLETHSEGRAYHNMIDKMCYVKDDYNDRSDHFSIAEERHNILNGKIKERINKIKDRYKDSDLYKMDKYFE